MNPLDKIRKPHTPITPHKNINAVEKHHYKLARSYKKAKAREAKLLREGKKWPSL